MYQVYISIIAAVVGPALLVMAPRSAQSEESLLWIAEAVWTDSVDSTTYEVGQRYDDGYAPVGRIALWMRIKGQEKALQILAQQGMLPILHVWYHKGAGFIIDEGVVKPQHELAERPTGDNIPFAINSGKIPGLRRELTERTFFDIRTWSQKKNVSQGIYRVEVIYATGESVMCETPDNGGLKPCEHEIFLVNPGWLPQ